jgi:pyrimidine operon attenuation protein / uracil phosphoribosyltransferase
VARAVERREKARVMDQETIRRTITRMAHEIVERNKGAAGLSLVGIQRRGVHLAERLAAAIAAAEDAQIPVGTLDVTKYRDDRETRPAGAEADTRLPFSVAGRQIVLVDDVLYTGRTVRAAIAALIDRGRPSGIQLAVLVDRGHRELPIRPDYVGKNLPTSSREQVAVRLREIDGVDEVVIEEPV